jgi:hypothetical protein
MRHVNIRRAVSQSILAAGLATSAFAQIAPFHAYTEQPAPNKGETVNALQFDLDFTKTSLNPAINYPTFPNPKFPQRIVKYEPYSFTASLTPGGCFEMASVGPTGSDLLLSVQNQGGYWVWLADDNGGNGQFKARLYIKSGAKYTVRISQSTTPNNNDQNGILVRKINADPGSAITASSCRVPGVPFWQPDLNLGNPYNPS